MDNQYGCRHVLADDVTADQGAITKGVPMVYSASDITSDHSYHNIIII